MVATPPLPARNEHHDGEDEENGDGPRIDDDLGGGEELRAHLEKEGGESGEVHDKEEGAVDGVSLEDHAGGGGHRQRRENPEGDEPGRHDGVLRITGMGRSAGMGTGEVGTPLGPAGSRASRVSLV